MNKIGGSLTRASFFTRENYKDYNDTNHPLEKDTEMTEEIIVTAETTEAPKETLVKKVLRHPKKLAFAAGVGLALVGGALLFAFKRMDEEDFDDEHPTEFDASADATETV